MAKIFSVPETLLKNLNLFTEEKESTNTYIDSEDVLQLHDSASLHMLSFNEDETNELDLSKIVLGGSTYNHGEALLEQRALINNDLDSEAIRTQYFTQCSRPIQWQDTKFLIEYIISFAKQCNIKVSDTLLDGCARRIVIVSFKTVNPLLVLKTMSDNSPNGEILSLHKRTNNALGNYNEWRGFLDHMHFDRESVEYMFSPEHGYGQDFPTLFHVSRLLRELKVSMDAMQTVKLYILVNVKGLKLLRSVQLFFSEHLPINVDSNNAACIFAASLAEHTFEPDVYAADLASLLVYCTMSPQLKQDLTAFQHRDDMHLHNTQSAIIRANKSRTRLYDRVKSMSESDSTASTGSPNSFEKWVCAAKLPPVSSGKKRGMAYLFMSLHELFKIEGAIRLNLKCLFKKDGTVQSILQHPVEHPEIGILVLLLKDITTVNAEEKLQHFKKECLMDFLSQEQKMDMDVSTVFQLYVCTFLQNDIWKEAWKQFSSLSHNVLVNVTHFRKDNLIDLDYVTTTCVANFDLESK